MSRPRGTLRWATAFALLALSAALASPQGASAQSPRPNLVVILTDDQRWDAFTPQFMPGLFERMISGQNAVFFDDAFVPNPLCCPSRVSILTGMHSSTTGVYSNSGSFTGPGGTGGGGFASFDDSPDVNPTVAVDLQLDGYRTAMIGKYLNKYEPKTMYSYVPPGWDTWFAMRTGSYYDYYVADGTTATYYPRSVANYSSTVLADAAVGFVQQGGRPFFLYLAPTAPHGPATPARVDKGRFADLVAAYPQPASVGEQDMSDKPLFLQGRVWDAKRQASADGFHERQLETIYSLDRQLQRVWDALPDNTVVIFTSDNGFLWGEHRWVGKRLPYNESIRVPMAIATKGMGMPLVYPDRIALNIDIRATLEGIAGLAPVTEGEDWGDPSWSRTQTLLEMWGPDQLMYCGLRTPTSLYVRWGTGEEELYDEVVDPLELDNLASSQPGALDAMRAKAAVPCTSGSVYPPGWPFPIQPAP